jgi:hypothetical protein
MRTYTNARAEHVVTLPPCYNTVPSLCKPELSKLFLSYIHTHKCARQAYLEITVIVRKHEGVVVQQIREDSLLEPHARRFRRAPIHKHVDLSRMPMYVTKKCHIPRSPDGFQHLFDRQDGRVQHPVRATPLPVQILPGHGAPVVAVNNSVRVQHGDDFEYEIVAQDSRPRARSAHEFEEPLHGPGGTRLSRMYAR